MRKHEMKNRVSPFSRRGFLSTAVTATIAFPVTRGRQSTENPTPVFRDSYSIPGLTNGISASGDVALFGFDDGNVMVNDDGRQGELIPLQVESSLSHIHLDEDVNNAVLVWQDSDLFGVLDLTVDDGDLIEHTGLWEMDATPDSSRVATVSQPDMGAGSVSVTTDDGDVLWETAFEDTVGLGVGITDDAEYVAAAVGEMWANGEQTGTPGIYLYGNDGDEIWSYETEEEVVTVEISGEREIVAVGTDTRRTLVLGFDGDEQWETDEFGGRIALSGDGSVLVADSNDDIHGIETEGGDELWRVETGFLLFDNPCVSTDGQQVLVSDRIGGEILVIEDGEIRWEELYEVGPVVGSLAADGSAWSVSIQNNEVEIGEVEQYSGNSQ